MKKWIQLAVLVTCLAAVNALSAEASTFNSVGMNIEQQQWQEMNDNTSAWTSFPEKGMIDMNKEWKITLSDPIKIDKILAAVIEGPDGFHPVSVRLENKRILYVKPTVPYKEDTLYHVKIFTANGQKYKLPFKTKSQPIALDLPPDTGFFTTIDVNTYGKGSVSPEKWTDGFLIHPPAKGKIQIEVTADAPIQVLATYEDSPTNLDASGFDKTTARLNFAVEAKLVYIHVRTHEDKEVNYTFSSYFTTYDYTEQEQQRINELKMKWAQWKPQYDGEQTIGTSFDPPIKIGRATDGALQDGLNMLKMVRYTAAYLRTLS